MRTSIQAIAILLVFSSAAQAAPTEVEVASRLNGLNGVRAPIDGLNCWGTTLVAAGLRKAITYTSDKEFKAVLNNPVLCRQLAHGERVERFAIGAIRGATSEATSGQSEELHGFLVLKGDRTFTKKDYTHESVPELRSIKRDFEIFADADSRYENCGPSTNKSGLSVRKTSGCKTWIDFYDCHSVLATTTVSTEIGKQLLTSLNSLTSELEALYRAGEPLTPALQTSLLDRMQPTISSIVDLPPSLEKDLLFGMYDSLAYQFMAVDANQKTKSEIH